MQSIGERFEEARKRKGISLREASEATKIRSDFLGSIEQDQFDFELPDIYKRGFIRNYARYLKLDPESLVTDYSAQTIGKTRGSKRGAELFGSMDVKGGTVEEPIQQNKESSYGHMSASPAATEVEEEVAAPEDDDSDKIFYIKAGLVFVGIIAVLFVLFGLARAIMGSGGDPEIETPALREPVTPAETVEPITPVEQPTSAGEESITLIASGNVYVLVKQRDDNQELFRKTLAGGETVTLSKTGPVDILFTAGENLVIVNPEGEKLRPEGEGTAKISIP